MVLAKSGAEGSWVIAAISAEWSAKARSKAGRKCSGRISANGGVSNGAVHGFSSGFAGASEPAAFCWVSDISNSRFRLGGRFRTELQCLCFDAFSSREPVSTSLENALKSCVNLYHAIRHFWAFYA